MIDSVPVLGNLKNKQIVQNFPYKYGVPSLGDSEKKWTVQILLLQTAAIWWVILVIALCTIFTFIDNLISEKFIPNKYRWFLYSDQVSAKICVYICMCFYTCSICMYEELVPLIICMIFYFESNSFVQICQSLYGGKVLAIQCLFLSYFIFSYNYLSLFWIVSQMPLVNLACNNWLYNSSSSTCSFPSGGWSGPLCNFSSWGCSVVFWE